MNFPGGVFNHVAKSSSCGASHSLLTVPSVVCSRVPRGHTYSFEPEELQSAERNKGSQRNTNVPRNNAVHDMNTPWGDRKHTGQITTPGEIRGENENKTLPRRSALTAYIFRGGGQSPGTCGTRNMEYDDISRGANGVFTERYFRGEKTSRNRSLDDGALCKKYAEIIDISVD